MPVLRIATAASLLLGLLTVPALAQRDAKKFLEEVRPIMLPEEEKQWKALKDKGDRDEFQRIFWARRDPDLETPENEYRAEYEKLKADADKRFVGTGRPGSETDCGRVYILLGPPDEAGSGEGGRTKMESPKLVRDWQTWTYRDRPGLQVQGGQIQISFDETCTVPQGARLGEQLVRRAESKIAHPNLDYEKGPDGKIVKLEDQLPKPSPAMALLKTPRQDFPATAENSMVLRTPDGATYVAGLVRVEPGAIAADGRAVLGAQAVTPEGKVAASSEREVKPDAAADGGALVSYGLALKPGDYTLKVGVLDPKTGKGSAVVQPLKVPDFGAAELSLSPLLVLKDVQDVAQATPQDAMAAFQLGNTRLLPRYGNVFSTQDAVVLLAFIYGGKVDEATGKPSLTASFQILRDGQPVAKAPEQTYDATPTGPSVGPVPLATYKPGKYVAQVKVTDKVAKKDYTGEATFEVK